MGETYRLSRLITVAGTADGVAVAATVDGAVEAVGDGSDTACDCGRRVLVTSDEAHASTRTTGKSLLEHTVPAT